MGSRGNKYAKYLPVQAEEQLPPMSDQAANNMMVAMRLAAWARFQDLTLKELGKRPHDSELWRPLTTQESEELARLRIWWVELGELKQGQVRRIACELSPDVHMTNPYFR